MSNIQNDVDFRMIADVKSGGLLKKEVLFKSLFILLLERLRFFQDFII